MRKKMTKKRKKELGLIGTAYKRSKARQDRIEKMKAFLKSDPYLTNLRLASLLNVSEVTIRDYRAAIRGGREKSRVRENYAAPVSDRRAPRKCLSCGTTFSSFGPGNRICGECRTLSAYRGGGPDISLDAQTFRVVTP